MLPRKRRKNWLSRLVFASYPWSVFPFIPSQGDWGFPLIASEFLQVGCSPVLHAAFPRWRDSPGSSFSWARFNRSVPCTGRCWDKGSTNLYLLRKGSNEVLVLPSKARRRDCCSWQFVLGYLRAGLSYLQPRKALLQVLTKEKVVFGFFFLSIEVSTERRILIEGLEWGPLLRPSR